MARSKLGGFVASVFMRPGAAALAMVALYSGLAGMFDIGASTDALAMLLPDWFTHTLHLVYIGAGAAMIVGMGSQRANIEGAGWILLATSAIVRGVVLVAVVGMSVPVVGLLVLYGAFTCAAVARVVQIVKGEVIVVAHVDRTEHA